MLRDEGAVGDHACQAHSRPVGFTGSDTGTALPNAKFMLQDKVTHFRSGRFFCIP